MHGMAATTTQSTNTANQAAEELSAASSQFATHGNNAHLMEMPSQNAWFTISTISKLSGDRSSAAGDVGWTSSACAMPLPGRDTCFSSRCHSCSHDWSSARSTTWTGMVTSLLGVSSWQYHTPTASGFENNTVAADSHQPWQTAWTWSHLPGP